MRVADNAHPSIVPFQNFQSADGWIVVACPKEKFWRALGREDLAADQRFEGFARLGEHREALLGELRPLFAQRSSAEWIERLMAAGVPCGPVNDIGAALAAPQVLARDGIVEFEHPALGLVRRPRSPLRVGPPGPARVPGPRPGEHTAEVLAALCGSDGERLPELDRQGVFG